MINILLSASNIENKERKQRMAFVLLIKIGGIYNCFNIMRLGMMKIKKRKVIIYEADEYNNKICSVGSQIIKGFGLIMLLFQHMK